MTGGSSRSRLSTTAPPPATGRARALALTAAGAQANFSVWGVSGDERVLGALRLPHWIAIGVVVAVLAGGVPSKWFGLVSSKITEVEQLRSCMEKHGAELASIVTSLGEPQEILGESPAAREHAVHVAERQHQLQRSQGEAVVACARTISG